MKRATKAKQRGKTITSDLNLLRQFYAEELRAVANLQSEAVVQAFAQVPREHFLGSGPWQVRSPGIEGYFATKDADPQRLYHNILVAIDATRNLNNGHPGLLAFLIDSLKLQEREHVVHVGCGTGYYTAIMAEVVGHQGHVTAIEVDHELAGRARKNVSYLPHVQVLEGDGGETDPGPSDAILSMPASHILALSGWTLCGPAADCLCLSRLPMTPTAVGGPFSKGHTTTGGPHGFFHLGSRNLLVRRESRCRVEPAVEGSV